MLGSANATEPAINTEISQPAAGTYYDTVTAATGESQQYLGTLIQQARNARLFEAPLWRTLVHYKKKQLFWTESQVDDPDFFLSKNGKTNPQAELEATLVAFYSKKAVGATKLEPQCRFPARYEWLKRQLNFDDTRLQPALCEQVQKYREAVDADHLTVVFPSTHPNSPSSMFGHTLLRIDKKDQTDDTRLLAFTLNYAALIPPQHDALSYAALGLTGGYTGRFIVMPYYMKLREYGQIENRDLWEYELNIPHDDVEFVLKHAFELAYTYFDYYFFSENCSYHLLSLLDVLYADHPMTAEYDFSWTIPVDTLKTLARRGLIKDARFYPSQARTITERRALLNKSERAVALQASQNGIDESLGKLEQFEAESQMRILDLLTEYQRYNKVEKSEEIVSSKLNSAERKTLALRSKIRLPTPRLVIPPPGAQPNHGHGTSRMGIAAGGIPGQGSDMNYSSLTWRAAYHDLLDPSQGFVSNSGLSFMDVDVRHYVQLEKTVLQRLTVLDIRSLEPRDEFFKNTSWRATIGYERADHTPAATNDWNLSAGGGGGYTYNLAEVGDNAWYCFIEAAARYENTNTHKRLAVVPGLSSGLIVEPIQGWRIHLSGKISKSLPASGGREGSLALEQGIALSQNVGLRIRVARERYSESIANKYSASLMYYF